MSQTQGVRPNPKNGQTQRLDPKGRQADRVALEGSPAPTTAFGAQLLDAFAVQAVQTPAPTPPAPAPGPEIPQPAAPPAATAQPTPPVPAPSPEIPQPTAQSGQAGPKPPAARRTWDGPVVAGAAAFVVGAVVMVLGGRVDARRALTVAEQAAAGATTLAEKVDKNRSDTETLRVLTTRLASQVADGVGAVGKVHDAETAALRTGLNEARDDIAMAKRDIEARLSRLEGVESDRRSAIDAEKNRRLAELDTARKQTGALRQRQAAAVARVAAAEKAHGKAMADKEAAVEARRAANEAEFRAAAAAKNLSWYSWGKAGVRSAAAKAAEAAEDSAAKLVLAEKTERAAAGEVEDANEARQACTQALTDNTATIAALEVLTGQPVLPLASNSKK